MTYKSALINLVYLSLAATAFALLGSILYDPNCTKLRNHIDQMNCVWDKRAPLSKLKLSHAINGERFIQFHHYNAKPIPAPSPLLPASTLKPACPPSRCVDA